MPCSYLQGTDLGDPVGTPIRLAAPPSLFRIWSCDAMGWLFLKLSFRRKGLSLEIAPPGGLVQAAWWTDSVDSWLYFIWQILTHSAIGALLPFHEKSDAVLCYGPRPPFVPP